MTEDSDKTLKMLTDSAIVFIITMIGAAVTIYVATMINVWLIFCVPVILVVGFVVFLWQLAKKTR